MPSPIRISILPAATSAVLPAAEIRGAVLDPSKAAISNAQVFGASAGFFRNPGYSDVGINLNYSAGHEPTLYGNLRNAVDR